MKAKFTLCLGLFFCFLASAWAQPANDDCASPQLINLNPPAPCPSTAPANTVINGTTIGATPISPYPLLQCSNGDQNDGPAAEVWYTFTGVSNILDIIIAGLGTPNIILFGGDDCSFLTPLSCDRGTPGALNFTTNILVGEQYFLMVSGGSVADQANFTLTLRSRNNCNPCLLDQALQVSPPPINGTYSSGQDVTFCMNINDWDVTGTVEWLHAVTVEFGPGWDLSTLAPQPPAACTNNGFWSWYDSWVGSNTGDVFGPGFAFDSSSGGPLDGNPGNNWGDPCQEPGGGDFPISFCWTVTVGDCVDSGGSNMTGDDLSMVVNIWSDGDSGSWTQTGCNSGFTFNFLASVVCCSGIEPLATPTPTTCPGADDGMIEIDPLGGGPYQYYVFFNNGSFPIITVPATSNIVTLDDLEVGSYSIVAVDVVSGCNLTVNPQPVVIDDGPIPTAIPDVNMPCPGDPFILTGSTDLSGSVIQYQWTGPGGFSQSGQTVQATQAGVYTLRVTVDGCQSQPQTVTGTFLSFTVDASAADASVCVGQDIVLTALGTDLVDVEWQLVNTGQNLGNDNPLSYTLTQGDLSASPLTFLATATDVNGCEDTDQVIVTVNPLPVISVTTSGLLCVGSTITATAQGANSYFWEDGENDNPRFFVIDQPGPFSMQVFGQDANGCQAEGQLNLFIDPSPNVTISAPATTICRGSSVTLTGNGAQTYNWSTGQNNQPSITVSPNATQTFSVVGINAAGCQDNSEITITVVDPIAAPVISCGPVTPSSVQFTWPAVAGATGYNVTVNTGQTGTLSGTTYTVNNLNPGTPVTITVVAVSPNAACPNTMDTETCTSQSCPPVNVAINPQAAICYAAGLPPIDLEATITGGASGTSTWTGQGIINAATGLFNVDTAGLGSHQIVLAYAEGLCVYRDTLVIQVFQTPTSSFTLDDAEICNNQTTTVSYLGNAGAGATYTWNFNGGTAVPGTGPGPHQVSWPTPGNKTVTLQVTENGCTSGVSSQMINITNALTPPNISCGVSTTTSTVFNWAAVTGATGYTVNVLSGPTGTLSGTSYSVTGLTPGQAVQIQVIAQTNDPCGPVSSNFTCSALPCPDFVFNITPVAPICLAAGSPPVTLVAAVSGGNGTGALTWAGPGVTGTTFNPVTAGAGSHTLTATYTEGPCSESQNLVVVVNPTPVASFTVSPSPVCVNQPATLTFNGSVVNAGNATFSWNFNGGTANPASGAGPIAVSWATAGSKTVTLTVTENGCVSSVFSQTIDVQNPMAVPQISCVPSPSSITFTWVDVPGATGYQANLLSGHTGTQNGNSMTVGGLVPGNMVELEVIALGNGPCGNSTDTLVCTAEVCPVINLAITPVQAICLNAAATAVDLSGTVTGGDGTGTETWSGIGITDAAQGIFDPTVAGPGNHTITFSYQQGNCPYSTSTVITVNTQPIAGFTAGQPVCTGSESTVTFTGTAGPGALFTWGFDGGAINSGSGAGPYQISWSTGGVKNISLVVTENNCPSEPFNSTVEVQTPITAPVINCTNTTTSVLFTWADVPGATGYLVEVLNGPAGMQSGNSYLIEGLMPEESVTIRVTANTANVCGSTSTDLTCSAAACPSVVLNPIDQGPLCTDSGVQNLTVDLSGQQPGGTLMWTGPGILTPSGAFDPAAVGPGTYTVTVTYQEGVCTYSEILDIDVFAVPVASFTASSPVCAGGTVQVVFDGAAGPLAQYDWDFAGGSVAGGSGAGPYTVSWADPGTKTISLTITDNGCVSGTFTADVEVIAPLVTPAVECLSSSTSSITFGWEPIAGATGYQVTVVNGPQGVLNGTTYSLNNLTPNTEITIQVVAVGTGPCGNSQPGEATCIANNCLPVNLNLSPSQTLCAGSSTQLVFDFTTTSAGPFIVTYSINGVQQAPVTLADNGTIPFNNISQSIDLQVISIQDAGDANCVYPGNDSWSLTVNQPVDAGTAQAASRFCQGEGAPLNLADLITGEQPGGTWTEISSNPSSGGAFNAVTGVFNPANQSPGTYQFRYLIDALAPCTDDETVVSVIVEATPNAVAGADQLLTCSVGTVSLGGNSSSGNGITYAWTADDPEIVISDPGNPLIDVNQPGIYTLTVTNELGCSSTDQVAVTSENASPVAEIGISEISCFQANDGAIVIENVNGGTPPYQYSFNGGPFNTQTQFAFLGPETYTLVVRDQNGCISELSINLTQPEELTVTLVTDLEVGQNTIEEGETITLRAVFNPNVTLDTIIWKPDSLALTGNPTAISVMPTATTEFSVTIIDTNGCMDSDEENIFVRKVRPVFIPNAFSPDDDGFNDQFYIHSRDNSVSRIKSFLVFNRWGETMMELYDFQPNDPSYGWDGRHRGRPMNPGVYVYYVEVEFRDGEIILYEGDVSLLK